MHMNGAIDHLHAFRSAAEIQNHIDFLKRRIEEILQRNPSHFTIDMDRVSARNERKFERLKQQGRKEKENELRRLRDQLLLEMHALAHATQYHSPSVGITACTSSIQTPPPTVPMNGSRYQKRNSRRKQRKALAKKEEALPPRTIFHPDIASLFDIPVHVPPRENVPQANSTSSAIHSVIDVTQDGVRTVERSYIIRVHGTPGIQKKQLHPSAQTNQ